MALKNYQYEEIMRGYNRRQLHNKHVLDERYREVSDRIPEFSALARQEADISLECATRLIGGDQNASGELSKKLAVIEQQRASLLAQCGFPADYLEMPYECPYCKDTGFLPDGQKCTCFKKAAIELLYDQSNRREYYEKENFDTFCLDYYSKETTDSLTGKSAYVLASEAREKAGRFVASFPTRPGNLLIYGPTGVGKTFLSNCIAKELIEQLYSVIHLDAISFFERLAAHRFHQEDDDAFFESIFDCDLLIIDDLGTEVLNSFVISSLGQCIDSRLSNKQATIITTNLELADLKEQYLDRTFSRLISGYTFLRMTGNDIRFQQKKLRQDTGN